MPQRAAGAQHIQVLGLEPRVPLLEHVVERIHQAVPEGIGVHVERRVHEVGDVGPEIPVLVVETDGRTQAFPLHVQPDPAQAFGAQLPGAAFVVDPALELMEGDLAHHRVQHVLHLAGEQDAPARRRRLAVEHGAEGEHLAEHRRRLRRGQGRVRHQRPLARRQDLMHPVSQLVRERHHVARPAVKVHQDIGVRRRHRGMGKGARILARPRRRVDPAVVEKAPGDVRHLGGETAVGVEHQGPGRVPGVGTVLVAGKGRGAVPVVQRFAAEPARLEPVIPVREIGKGVPDRSHQRLHHRVVHLVVQVALGNRKGELAPLILDLLVLGEHVGDEREQAQLPVQHPAQGLGRFAADGTVVIGQRVQDIGEGQGLAVHRKTQVGNGFLEQAHPRRAPRDGLLVQNLLHLVGKLMGTKGAGVPDPGRVPAGGGAFELPGQHGVVQAVELEGEKQGFGRDVRRPFLHGLVKAPRLGIADIGGEDELGVAGGLAQALGDPLVGGDGLAQGRPVEVRQAPLVAPGEGLRLRLRPRQVGLQFRCIGTGIKVFQVPFGKGRFGLSGARARGLGHGRI